MTIAIMHPSVIHLASGNAHKVAEFEKLARESAPGLTLRSALDAGGMPLVEEDAGTFVGNARKKALALQSRLPAGSWVLADDSGLCVDALEGAPGVESAYFAGAESDAKANLEKLVRVMEKVPEDRRGAHFVCVLVMIDADNGERVFEGRCDGSLARVPRAGGGFGYDPLFIPAGEGKTFAELADSAKNRLSHRARAWAKFAEWWTGESG